MTLSFKFLKANELVTSKTYFKIFIPNFQSTLKPFGSRRFVPNIPNTEYERPFGTDFKKQKSFDADPKKLEPLNTDPYEQRALYADSEREDSFDADPFKQKDSNDNSNIRGVPFGSNVVPSSAKIMREETVNTDSTKQKSLDADPNKDNDYQNKRRAWNKDRNKQGVSFGSRASMGSSKNLRGGPVKTDTNFKNDWDTGLNKQKNADSKTQKSFSDDPNVLGLPFDSKPELKMNLREKHLDTDEKDSNKQDDTESDLNKQKALYAEPKKQEILNNDPNKEEKPLGARVVVGLLKAFLEGYLDTNKHEPREDSNEKQAMGADLNKKQTMDADPHSNQAMDADSNNKEAMDANPYKKETIDSDINKKEAINAESNKGESIENDSNKDDWDPIPEEVYTLCLDMHNKYRSKHYAEPLRYDARVSNYR